MAQGAKGTVGKGRRRYQGQGGLPHFLSQPYGSMRAQEKRLLASVGNGGKLLNQDSKEFFSRQVNGAGGRDSEANRGGIRATGSPVEQGIREGPM
jgi:hypothetical protein